MESTHGGSDFDIQALDAVLYSRLSSRNARQSGCFEELALLFACQKDSLTERAGVSQGKPGEIGSEDQAAGKQDDLPSSAGKIGFPKSVFELQRVVLDLRNQIDALRASCKETNDSLRLEQAGHRRTEKARVDLSAAVDVLTSELQQLRGQSTKTEERYLEILARNHDLETRIVEEKLKMAEILNEMNASMGQQKSKENDNSTVEQFDGISANTALGVSEDVLWTSNIGVDIPKTWKVLSDSRGAQISSVAYSSDGSLLASGASNGVVQLWSPALLTKVEGASGTTLKSPVLCVDVRGTILLATSERACYLWRIKGSTTGRGKSTLEALHTLTGHATTVVAGKLAPDCRHAASGARKVKIWEVESGNSTLTIDARSKCLSLDFNPSGSMLITGHADKSVRLWDMKTGKIAHTFEELHRQPITHVCFSADGERIMSTSMDNQLSMVQLKRLGRADDELKPTYLFHPEFRANAWWCKGAVSPGNDPKGRLLAACGTKDGTLHVWDADGGESLYRQDAHSAAITCTAWSPKGNELVTCDAQGAMIVWHTSG